ncbi:MAG: hypothetical protein L0207_01120 [Chlamydiae bacterium]|nr:hypothetical protein [Chlamydiota bacterium]
MDRVIVLMQSKSLLKELVQNLGLQIDIRNYPYSFAIFSNILTNLSCTLSSPKKSDQKKFEFRSVRYEEDLPLILFLRFKDGENFSLLDEKKNLIASKRVGDRVELSYLSFVLEKIPKDIQFNYDYELHIQTWMPCVRYLLKRLAIKPHKLDNSCLNLTIMMENPFLAAELLNELMKTCQSYLKKEHDKIAIVEREYIQDRFEKLNRDFSGVLDEQVKYLKKHLFEKGSLSLSDALEILVKPREEYSCKLFDLDMQLKYFQSLMDMNKEKSSIHHLPKFAAQDRAEKTLASLEEIQIGNTSPFSLENSFGFDINSIRKLCVDYSEKKDAIKMQADQLNIFLKEIFNSNFEIGMISSWILDPIAQEIVRKAAALSFDLHDSQNHTEKEQERVKETLFRQKKYLADYIKQTIALNEIQEKLYEKHIDWLKKAGISLIQSEKQIIQSKLVELKQKMEDFPEEWKLENNLKFKKDLYTAQIASVSRIAENNLLNHLLHQNASKPIDLAIASPFPVSSPFRFSFAAFFLGVFASFLILLFIQLKKGFPLSAHTFKDMGKRFFGYLSIKADSLDHASPQDLEVLRKVSHFIQTSPTKIALIIGGKGVDFSKSLAMLFSNQEKKTLLIHITLANGSTSGLQENFEKISVAQEEGYDLLALGGEDRITMEKLFSQKFASLLEKLKQTYDLILIYTKASLSEVESEILLDYADAAIVVIREETVSILKEGYPERKGMQSVGYVINQT